MKPGLVTSKLALATLLLTACSGGGGNPGACVGSSLVCTTTSESPASTPIAAVTSRLCNIDVGPQLITGLVVSVHDGDTVRVSSGGTEYSIRLDSIDAPELAQPYGQASQAALSNMVLNKTVRVAYSKTDQYGRVVGAIFTDTCQYANLQQVAAGMAWFYKAYQCEISAASRLAFQQAQDTASTSRIGLWAQADPEAPWFYRNGTEPVTPTCTSDLPAWAQSTALSATGATATVGTSTTVSTPTGSAICYTGPRGGTYTLTASGNKNYSGC